MQTQQSSVGVVDPQSEGFLDLLEQEKKVLSARVPGVRSVLVVLSSAGMVYDTESLRQKILIAYPDAAVFFLSAMGKPVGQASPKNVDLLIDFTEPGSRQGLFFARKLRRMARLAVGRNAGFFRKKIFDRVFDERSASGIPNEILNRERVVQRQVLHLAGVPFMQMGDTPPDRGKSIALDLPPMQRM